MTAACRQQTRPWANAGTVGGGMFDWRCYF